MPSRGEPHQPPTSFSDSLQMLQPPRERQRHLFAARPLVRVFFGQKQARFQVGKPCRHHEIVGRDLKPKASGRLNEGKVLLGERQNGDLREVNLLVARKLKKEIERPLEPSDIDDEAFLDARGNRFVEIVRRQRQRCAVLCHAAAA